MEIFVGNESLEFESQDSVNLRINHTIYNPEKVSVTQSEYSYSFDVPKTQRNNRIFGFANVPSVRGKFLRAFDCHVLADGIEIFNGKLRLSKVEEDSYQCNLISVKNNDIEGIFGDTTMDKVKWYVDYVGASTINSVNQEDDPDYFFPLVCYGAFQKSPYMSISSDSTSLSYYTSTNLLDKWAKYYAETFIPSMKLIEIVKRMIEQKGYTWSGDAFTDDLIGKVYLSSYLSDEQDPAYNLGTDMGSITVEFQYSVPTYRNYSAATSVDYTYSDDSGIDNEIKLSFPTDFHHLNSDGTMNDDLNKEVGGVYDLMGDGAVVTSDNKEMYERGFIVIPHDGYYKIRMTCTIQLMESTYSQVQDSYQYIDSNGDIATYEFTRDIDLTQLPHEVQLVKNDSNSLEFSSTNKINFLCHPYYIEYGNNYEDKMGAVTDYTDYPHESPYTQTSTGGSSSNNDVEYYYQPQGKTRSYDRSVNDDFIMGMSTSVRQWAIAKRGRSWNYEYSDKGYNNYKCAGYTKYTVKDGVATTTSNTDYQSWQDTDIPECTYTRLSTKQHTGVGFAIVWLEKNDLLSAKLLTKQYSFDGGSVGTIYQVPAVDVRGSVTVTAWSPNKSDLTKSYYGSSSFDEQLNLGNFLNDEQLQSDFMDNFLTTFNLNCNIEDGNIDISKNVSPYNSSECVSIDDRVNVDEAETEVIDFPTKISVEWSVDTDESGFYHSVDDDHLEDDDWTDYGDYGSEEVELITNEFSENEISETSDFSYNWWMDFSLTDYYVPVADDEYSHVSDGSVVLTMPIIAKDEDFIDGADYEDMMSTDGRSLNQRMWFKDTATDYYVPNRNYATVDDAGDVTECDEYLNICLPTRYYNGLDVLRYVNEKNTLLTLYFNINENVDSNYLTIDAHLTPMEYLRLRNGAMVRFDDDRYIVCSIKGYDPTGGNATELELMKC